MRATHNSQRSEIIYIEPTVPKQGLALAKPGAASPQTRTGPHQKARTKETTIEQRADGACRYEVRNLLQRDFELQTPG